MIEMWATAPQDLQSLKLDIIGATGLAKDALHIYGGLTIFILIRLVWRRRGGWWLAWIATLVLALGVEWLDMRADAAGTALQPDGEHWHDVWNTMFWPSVLLLFGPWLQPKPKAELESGDFADEPLEEPAPV